MSQVYIAFGSNVGDSARLIREALARLNSDRLCWIQSCSRLIGSVAWGHVRQPDFVNAVACCETHLDPWDLLAYLKRLEKEFGRIVREHWGPRELDLDILLYDHLTIAHADLTIPHGYLKERPFVVWPLKEIAPDLVLPCGESIESVSKRCAPVGLFNLLS